MQVATGPSRLGAHQPKAAARTPQRPSLRCAAGEAGSNTCKMCGTDLAKKPWGCDEEGRVAGGLGALPGMGWWPIKAYRPCPQLGQAGLEYVRKGQGTNEMLFGGVSLGQSGSQSLDAMKEQADRGIKIE